MINRFREFVVQHQLFTPSDNILVAVSGGIDSMVLWRLFEEAGYPYAVVHCNFQLRGDDSDRDEALVREQACRMGIQIYVRRFDTLEYAGSSGISIEMAARELRYQWFEEIRSAKNFSYLATAHQRDDLLETFFINLVRKTGIRGLSGFREKSGKLVRPLLFAYRKEIETWAKENNIDFRQDRTNDETIFQRNFIRHQIIPQLEKLNPAFRVNLAATITNLRETEDFYQTEIDRQIRKISNSDSDHPEIFISQLMKLPHPRQVLFEWMCRYNFSSVMVETLFFNLGRETGRQYYSKTHRLVTDRNKLIITLLPEDTGRIYYIEEEDHELTEPVHLALEKRDAHGFELIRDPRCACLDTGKLTFPLIVRKWQAGEYFQPLGMSGFKKISDFFVDEKLSIPEKEQTWIIYSSNKVVWIIGQRLDNRFRVTPDTREVLVIRLK